MRTSYGRRANEFGRLTGLDPMLYAMVAPGRTRLARLRRWVWRKMWRLLKRITRRGWTRRRILLPWAIGAAAWIVSALASLSTSGAAALGVVGGLGALAVYRQLGGPALWLTRRRGLPPGGHRWWYASAYASLVALSVLTAAWKLGPPMPGFWVVAVLGLWIRWIWHHRNRSAGRAKAGTTDLTGYHATWAEVKPLAGSTLTNLVELDAPRRWEADVDLTETELLVSHVTAAVPHISKKFRVPALNIIADYGPGRLEHAAHLTVVKDNPCEVPALYDESWIPTAEDIAQGVVPFHQLPTGGRGKARLWYPRAGTVNSLFSGDIGSGKSAGMEAKAIQAMMTGKVWVMAGDPQGGASLPALCGADGQAKWKAACQEDDLGPIWDQLCFLREAMFFRSEVLGRFQWTNQHGDELTGLASWDPDITGWPAIGYTLDEVWRLMQIPEFAAIIKELLKMQRKVGFYMDMATQYPAIDEFNNDMGLRQCITAGNMFSYYNSANTVKNMILPSDLPGPDKIPTESPTGEHTKGMLIVASKAPRSSPPAYSRSVWAERNVYWAKQAAEKMPDLEPALEKVLAKHRAPKPQTSGQPERETVVVTSKPKRETILTRILAFLAAEPNGWAHTGVIADALNVPAPSVSTTLGRALEKGQIRKHREGIWALPSVEEKVNAA